MNYQSKVLEKLKMSYIFNDKDGAFPIVFIHGNSSSKNIFQTFLKEIDYPCFALDLPGHGESLHLFEYSIPKMAEFVVEALRELNIINPIFIGTSLGGHVATHCLKLMSARAIIMWGTPSFTQPIQIGESFNLEGNHSYLYTMPQSSDDDLTKLYKEINTSFSLQNLSEFINDYNNTDSLFRETLINSLSTGNYFDELNLLKETEIPVLFIHGKNDPIIFEKYIRKISDSIEKSSFELYDNCSHNLHIDDPKQLIKSINNFLIINVNIIIEEGQH